MDIVSGQKTGETIQRKHGIHGSPAMREILKTLNLIDDHGSFMHVGWYVLWSDGFIRSWIRQKHNNVWILIMTFPDPEVLLRDSIRIASPLDEARRITPQ